jgi:hypothetical protein
VRAVVDMLESREKHVKDALYQAITTFMGKMFPERWNRK